MALDEDRIVRYHKKLRFVWRLFRPFFVMVAERTEDDWDNQLIDAVDEFLKESAI